MDAGDPTDQGKDGSREVPESERRAHGYAVAGLNALSALGPEVHPEWGLARRDDEITTLTEAIRGGELGVPRVLVLDALVKLAKRRPSELASAQPALDDLLLALVQDAGVPVERQGAAVETVQRALDSVARRSVLAPARHPWKRFASDVRSALGLTQAEVDKPLCNDRQVVLKAGVEAIGVTVDFHTDAAPAEMSVCDPTSWHECTAAFRRMQPWNDPAAVDEQRPGGWRRDLIETVDFLPGMAALQTPLRFTYSIDDDSDPAWIHLDYVLIEETGEIAVDEGSIDVRRETAGEHSGRTRVSTKKLISFKDPMLAKWPTVACDTFWTDLVVNAAVGCLGGATHKPKVNGDGGSTSMADPKHNLSAAIDEAAAAARESIGVYSQLAEQAASQLSGAGPADNAAWLQLATKAYGRALSDAARSWTIYSEMLIALAEPPDPPPDV